MKTFKVHINKKMVKITLETGYAGGVCLKVRKEKSMSEVRYVSLPTNIFGKGMNQSVLFEL